MTEALPFSLSIEWLPLFKALGFFFATFILEDVAAVGAGLLLAAGDISWPAAFTACFLGIWLGDIGLYALARFAGREWFERSSFRRHSKRVASSEKWFARRGTVILIFSRVIPGARLPTYLAAGFLRLPLPKFLFVTGAAAFLWTLLILWLVQLFGKQVTQWLGQYKSAGLLLLGTGILILLGLQVLRKATLNFNPRKLSTAITRWTHWEFWPMWLFYPPVAIYYGWLSLKHRSALLPTAANPGIFSGGVVGESKIATLKDLSATSPEFTAEAVLLMGNNFAERLASLDKAVAQFDFPLILKPDLGQRGVGIKLIRTHEQAENYLRQTTAPLIAQSYAPGPLEAGIFYYRFPGEPSGKIFAITEKVFPEVTGDGQSTIAELVLKDPRARFMAAKYLARFGDRQNNIPAVGETVPLVAAGNHAQGCIFRDGARWNSTALEKRIDEISKKLNGFFIGRYDIRFASENDLRAGKNFQIIELNGAAAEATSIYDSRNSLWTAYRTLFRQWDLIFAIGAENRLRGCATTSPGLLWRTWRDYTALATTYPEAD